MALNPLVSPRASSPFSAPPVMDLNGWRFGALIVSPMTFMKIGFFIDPHYVGPACESYARMVPGSSMSEALLAVGLPGPIKALLERWRPGATERSDLWHGSAQSHAKAYPDRIYNHPGHVRQARFAWIHASSPLLMDDQEKFEALSCIATLWRAELESRGARCLDWTGDALVAISNGFNLDELSERAGAQSDAAFSRAALEQSTAAGFIKPKARL
jgi:hypothetical protein